MNTKTTAAPERLTRRQEDVLFVVSQREPVTARDVAHSLLSTDTAERSRLDGLCRRGLLDRQYTGLRAGERVGYVLTLAGLAALDALDLDEDYDPTENELVKPARMGLPTHAKGDGWFTICGQDRANVVHWTDDPSKVTCRRCADG